MKPAPITSHNQPKLSSKEYTILRAFLMGLSELALLQLLHCTKQELNKYWYEIFTKLKVENTYLAIKKALQMGLISEENYQPEYIKEATLAFLDERGVPLSSDANQSNNRGVTYQYLLNYQSFLNHYNFINKYSVVV